MTWTTYRVWCLRCGQELMRQTARWVHQREPCPVLIHTRIARVRVTPELLDAIMPKRGAFTFDAHFPYRYEDRG